MLKTAHRIWVSLKQVTLFMPDLLLATDGKMDYWKMQHLQCLNRSHSQMMESCISPIREIIVFVSSIRLFPRNALPYVPRSDSLKIRASRMGEQNLRNLIAPQDSL